MSKSTEKMLNEEMIRMFQELANTEVTDEKRKEIIDELVALHALKIDIEKINLEFKDKFRMKKDVIFKAGVDVATTIMPLVFYAFWMTKGFKFEETGSYSSTTFKNLFSRFKPTK